jgi:hypothetical protein
MLPHDVSGDYGVFVVVGMQLAKQINQGLVLRSATRSTCIGRLVVVSGAAFKRRYADFGQRSAAYGLSFVDGRIVPDQKELARHKVVNH